MTAQQMANQIANFEILPQNWSHYPLNMGKNEVIKWLKHDQWEDE